MANIHITLIGGQTTPVYQGIVAANPDKVVLIHSPQTKEEANRIHAEIKVDCELKAFDPVNLHLINKAIQDLKKTFSQEDILSINLSSGTKAWTLLFYENFKEVNHALLVVIDQNNLMWNLKTHQSTELQFDMDVQFRLYGNPLKTYTTLDDFTSEDYKMISEIRSLRSFSTSVFNALVNDYALHPNQTSYSTNNNCELIRTKTGFLFTLYRKDTKKQTELKSPSIQKLLKNAAWFEYEIAMLLSEWKYAKEIRMQCIFPTKNKSPKNEIDIILNTGKKLLFVECKTQITHESDIDKFNSAVKNYGGMGSKALFVTDEIMSNKALEKCNEYNIIAFSLKANRLVTNQKALFLCLENELFNLNIK